MKKAPKTSDHGRQSATSRDQSSEEWEVEPAQTDLGDKAVLQDLAMRVLEGASTDELWPELVHLAQATLDFDLVALARYNGGRCVVVASTNDSLYPPGVIWPSDDDGSDVTPGSGGPDRRSTVSVIVDGGVWGVLSGVVAAGRLLGDEVERRLGRFGELAAAAISNDAAHDQMRRLAAEQAALRRVAQLVAEEEPPERVFDAVAQEASRVIGLARIGVYQFNDDGSVTVVGTTKEPTLGPVGLRVQLDGPSVLARIRATGSAARANEFSKLPGTTAMVPRDKRFGSAVGAPIIVDGRTWGAVVAVRTTPEPFAADIETRIGNFTELLSTSIANVQARDRLHALALEQGALRRVATLVAETAPPNEVFDAVAQEASRVLDVPGVGIYRYNPDRSVTVVSKTTDQPGLGPVGETWPLDGPSVVAAILDSNRSARIDDWSALSGTVAEVRRSSKYVSAVGAPITVEGELWGAIVAISEAGNTIPLDGEVRLQNFTHLVASAISNVQARDDLIASRARIVTAADEARRRIERDLHDGIQQRLLSLGFRLKALRRAVPAGDQDTHAGLERVGHDLENLIEEARDVSRGLHPPTLSRYGLGPALGALARRSALPVRMDIRVGHRPSEPIETAMYYVISEAVSNAVKHSGAEEVLVVLVGDDELVSAVVTDDGVGGAKVSAGSGLIGMVDRVEALGGRLTLSSPPGAGTRISVEFPAHGHPAAGARPARTLERE